MNQALSIPHLAQGVLDAIQWAQDAGSIDHLDCASDSNAQWYQPIEKLNQALRATFCKKPWGSYQDLFRSATAVAKIIVVNPGGRLSLQRHKNRSEFWVVESGVAHVTHNDWHMDLVPGKTLSIGPGEVHRLENWTKEPLRVLELQWGAPDEADIERFEDKYGRK